MIGESSQNRAPLNPALRYGRVFFDLRRRFDLSIGECLLIDVRETLSQRTGWSYASRAYLASIFGVSTRSIRRLIARLAEIDLIEIGGGRRRQLRPTPRWLRAKESVTGGQPGRRVRPL